MIQNYAGTGAECQKLYDKAILVDMTASFDEEEMEAQISLSKTGQSNSQWKP